MSAAVIRRFYEAFDAHDGEAMAACYAPGARFEDPAFGELRGDQVGGMWRMLTGRATDLRVELHEHDGDERTGRAHWIARYTFSTGRPVVNDIQATFGFEDGLIAEHVDRFDFGRWARQALGPMGIAMTVVPPLRGVVRRKARGDLEAFLRA
ncbi:MAG: nuclear transport factor 2 family protein [Thermoleophilaceae bacterium]